MFITMYNYLKKLFRINADGTLLPSNVGMIDTLIHQNHAG